MTESIIRQLPPEIATRNGVIFPYTQYYILGTRSDSDQPSL